MPEVSVVVPTYNRASVLPRCLNSITNQTFKNFEIIVVDDCSTDNTKQVTQEYDEERLEYIRHNKNKGGAVARNTGIEAASGQYTAFLDSDDEWLPKKLEKQMEVFNNGSDQVGAVYTGHYIIDSNSRRQGRPPTARGDIYEKQLMYDQVNPTSTVVVKKCCFEDAGKFDPDLPARQDYDLWIRLSEEYDFDYVPEPLAKIHEYNDDRISTQYRSRMKANKIMLDRVADRIENYGLLRKRKIMAKQYEAVAGFSYISKKYNDARKFLLLSIYYYPVGPRRWLLFPLIFLAISPDNEILLSIKRAAHNKYTERYI